MSMCRISQFQTAVNGLRQALKRAASHDLSQDIQILLIFAVPKDPLG